MQRRQDVAAAAHLDWGGEATRVENHVHARLNHFVAVAADGKGQVVARGTALALPLGAVGAVPVAIVVLLKVAGQPARLGIFPDFAAASAAVWAARVPAVAAVLAVTAAVPRAGAGETGRA